MNAKRSGWIIRGCWFAMMGMAAAVSFPALADQGNIKIGMVGGIPFGFGIADMAMAPDRKKIILAGFQYVNKGWAYHRECMANPVLIVDAVQDKVIGGPSNETGCGGTAAGISPNNTKAYVGVNRPTGGTDVEIIDMASNRVTGLVRGLDSLSTGNCVTEPSSISFAPDGGKAYVAYATCRGGDIRIAVIDAMSDAFIGWVKYLQAGAGYSNPRVKFDPNAARHTAYVTDAVGVVQAVNTLTDTVDKTVVAKLSDAILDNIDFSRYGDKAFVPDLTHCGIVTIDVATASQVGFTPMSSCNGGGGVYGVAVSFDGASVYAISTSDKWADCPEDCLNDFNRTLEVMDAGGRRIGLVADYDGGKSNLNGMSSPIVFTPRNGGTAYVAKNFYAYDESTDSNVSSSDIAVVRVPAVPAQIKALSPSTGADDGGARVSITGAHLTGTTSVLFGGVAGKDVKVVSDSNVTVLAPQHPEGPTDVTVVNPGGNATLTSGFTYVSGRSDGDRRR
jgi:hypothetical protein